MPETENNPVESQPSSVPVAYDLSLKSMDIVIKRFESQDANLDRIITWISGFTAAGVTVLAAKHQGHLDFDKCSFYFAATFFILGIAIALIGKYVGQIEIINPKLLYEGQLDLDSYEFKKNHIYYLGENFELAMKDTKIKWLSCILASIAFTLEIVFLIFWAASNF